LRCQVCGRENPEGGLYCENCGAIVVAHLRPDDPKLKDVTNEIRGIVASRRDSDIILPAWIIWFPILLYVGSTAAMLVAAFAYFPGDPGDFEEWLRSTLTAYGVIIVISAVNQLILATIAFFLIKRANGHARREARLKAAITKLVRAAAGDSREGQAALSRELQQLELMRESGVMERSPTMWALLVALPIIGTLLFLLSLVSALETASFISSLLAGIALAALFGLAGFVANVYVFYFLGKELSDHEDRWTDFAMSARTLLSRLGLSPGRGFQLAHSPDRSFALYLVLLIFIPFFSYYWWYALIKDPNEHYRNQWLFEDNLLETLSHQPARPTS